MKIEELIRKHIDQLTPRDYEDHYLFPKKINLNEINYSLIDEFAYLINWHLISLHGILDHNNYFLEKYIDYIEILGIIIGQNLSQRFIENNKNKFYRSSFWEQLFQYQKIPESFLEKNKDIVPWNVISQHQNLSEDFIRRMINYISYFSLSSNLYISSETKIKFNINPI